MHKNNYYIPSFIKIINIIDTMISILAFSMVAILFMDMQFENILGSNKFALVCGILLIIYSLVCVVKLAGYLIYHSYGYKYSAIGLILYFAWAVATGLLTLYIFFIYAQ